MIKRLFHLVWFTLLSVSAFTQNANGVKRIAEIHRELSMSKPDTNKVLLYVDLCTAYQWHNLDSLNYYGEKAISLARELKYPKGEVRIRASQGIALSFRGDIPKALDILFRALRLAQQSELPFESAICLNGIGACYRFLNDKDKSLEFIKKAIALIDFAQPTARDLYWKIFIEFWCGTVYSDLEKNDSAVWYLQRAYDKAFDSSYIDLYSIKPTISMFYGKTVFREGNHKKAFDYLHLSLATYELHHDGFGIPDVCSILAGCFKQLKQNDSVIFYAKKGLATAMEYDFKTGIANNSRILSDAYESTDIAQSHKYLKLLTSVNDSLYGAEKIKDLQKTLSEEHQSQQTLAEAQKEKENRQRQYLFLSCIVVLLVIATIFFMNNRQKHKTNTILNNTLSDLKATQKQLIQSEKMASLGELTAGIAHEIQNPLNFVNNFSEVNLELVEELDEAVGNSLPAGQAGQEAGVNTPLVSELLADIKQNLEKINHHGKRADAIVKGMLQHSRTTGLTKELTDINKLADEYLRLAYHGMRAKDNSFNATLQTDFDESIGNINIIPQDIGRVILNVINNAFHAVDEKKKTGVENFEPTVFVSTKKEGGNVLISIKDNGNGIPQKILDKIFQPFFTTKPTGQGTGLGLSLSYDIVKAHGGELKVETKEGEGTRFIIVLPAEV